jgi:poly(3-hydroxybutyrate) depolymerase
MKPQVFLILLIGSPLHAQSQSDTDLKPLSASGHPMQYFVSLPNNWSASKEWPVVLVLEAAEKEYRKNLERFISARADMPFILVAPIHTGNGNQRRRDPAVFPYSAETWDYIDKVGDCAFNAEGFRHIMADVQKRFHGEEKYFITGFEAGAHMVWSQVFNHPEYLRAAAPVAGNYRSRCVDASAVSKDPSRVNLPVTAFAGLNDEGLDPNSVLYAQWTDAKDLAIKNSYTRVSEKTINGKGHVPMPDEVLQYFYSLLDNR